MPMKINKLIYTLLLLFIFSLSVRAQDSIDGDKKFADAATYNQTKSRVYIFRKSSQLILGGVSASIGGRKYASLAKREFDIFDYNTGGLTMEIAQNWSIDLCKMKVTIDPLKDNYLLIRDRNFSVAGILFDQTIFGLVTNVVARASSGDCSGKNEIIECKFENG